jgi:hypothetical protein
MFLISLVAGVAEELCFRFSLIGMLLVMLDSWRLSRLSLLTCPFFLAKLFTNSRSAFLEPVATSSGAAHTYALQKVAKLWSFFHMGRWTNFLFEAFQRKHFASRFFVFFLLSLYLDYLFDVHCFVATFVSSLLHGASIIFDYVTFGIFESVVGTSTYPSHVVCSFHISSLAFARIHAPLIFALNAYLMSFGFLRCAILHGVPTAMCVHFIYDIFYFGTKHLLRSFNR